MKTFYFNSGVKPWNTNVEMQLKRGNKFINNELHHPYIVEDDIPDNASKVCLCDNPKEYINKDYFIVSKVIGGNMCSKYAVFRKN